MFWLFLPVSPLLMFRLQLSVVNDFVVVGMTVVVFIGYMLYSGTVKVLNCGLGMDPDLSAKNGPERFGIGHWVLNRLVPM